MSAYPTWTIACSVDGLVIDYEDRGPTMSAARANARALGWKTGRGLHGPDYCPEHRPDRTSPDSSSTEEKNDD